MKSSAICAINCATENFPRELSSMLPATASDNQFELQTAARTSLQQLYHDHMTNSRKEEYNLLDIAVPRSYSNPQQELAKDAVFHFIKREGRK